VTTSARTFWIIIGAGVLAVAGFVAQVVLDPGAPLPLVDLSAYQIAGDRVLDGVALYDAPLIGTTKGVFEFVYTPFSALLFVLITAFDGAAFIVVGLLVNLALLVGIVWVGLVQLGHERSGRLPVVALALAGVLLWCQPVRETLVFGQINLFLAALVLVDLVLPARVRWKGALIGIATGIKLTPAFFVLYLLVTKQYRAVAVAVGASVATVLVGALVLPADSVTFWSGAFLDPARVGVPTDPGNQTLRGLIARTLGAEGAAQLLWSVLAAVIAVAGLWLAARLSRSGRELAAVLVCGLTATAVSPFSWVHHWVWLGVLLVHLLDRALRRGTVAAWPALVGTAAISVYGFFAVMSGLVGMLGWPDGNVVAVLYQSAYVWFTVAVLVVVAVSLRRTDKRAVTPSRGT